MAIAICLCLQNLVVAQEITASLNGVVRDVSGSVVPGATVTITDSEKGNIVVRTITTNDDGEYSVPNIAVGVYQVTVQAPNFKKAVKSGVKLDLGQRRSIDISLEAGNISEVVTVEADAIAVELQSATSGTVISGNQVREIPINNRNFTQLVALAPGVSNDLSDQVYQGTVNPDGQANTVQISVNGARSSQNTFTVDGADITDRGSNLTIQAYPSVDSIGEFRILRSLYPAESGRSGGGQVNVITRSGGDKLSGSAFEFIRNEAFNANDFITNQVASAGRDADGKAKRRPFRYNNFGFTLGGPVYFFNFGEKDPKDPLFTRYQRTFFFFSEEIRKDKRFPTLVSTVPDANLRNGIFPVDICLQASGAGTAATCTAILPAGTALSTVRTINPIATQYLNSIYNKLPLPNSVTATAPYGLIAPALNIGDFRQEILKIDHSVNDKVSMFYRYQQDKIPTTDVNALFSSGASLPGVSTTATNSPGKTHTAQVTYALSSNLIFESKYTYGYGAILSENIGTLALSQSPIAPPLPFLNQRDRVPTITGNGFSGLTSFGPYDNFSYKSNFSQSVTWIAGDHSLKFGIVYSKYRKNENALAGNNEGIYNAFLTPGGTATILATGLSGTLNTNRQNWANFLLGTNVNFTQAAFDYTADLRQKAFEGYAQDEWRARGNLTLYYGVRYSFFGSPWDKNGRLSNFDPSLWKLSDAPAVTGAGNRVVGTGNFCNGVIVNSQNYLTAPNGCNPISSPYGKFIMDVSKKDFAPRFGMAWDPFGKGTTAIRSGYGIYHEQVLNGTALQQIGANQPYQQTATINNTRLDQPVPTGAAVALVASLTAANVRAIQTNFNTPYMQHWSLDLQQQLTKNTIVTVGYYGSKGTHLIGSFEANLLAPGKAINSQCATGANYIGQAVAPTLSACQVAGTGFFSAGAEAVLDQLRPFRGYRAVTIVQPRYNSSYHSMQVSAQHRFALGSSVDLSYTWAKNLTDNQNDRSAAPQNSFDISIDKGRAALDRRHILSVNYIYELPFFSKQEGFVGKLLGGWQASGIVTYNTGLPFTATTSAFDPAGVGLIPPPTTVARPNVLCDPNVGGARTFQQWFNTTCFAANPLATATNLSNTVGNAGRGIINGPNTARIDFALTKNLRFGETWRVQLKAEAFNIANHTNFRAISTNVTVANYGQVTTVRDPRTMQFGAKVNF